MKVEEYETDWSRDSIISDDISGEIQKTAKLHSKWYSHLNRERRALMIIDVELQKTKNMLESFYGRTLTFEEMKKYNIDELPEKRLLKGDLEKAVDNDKRMIEMKVRRGVTLDCVRFLEDVIKSIHSRGFLIRDMIEWKKFEAGV